MLAACLLKAPATIKCDVLLARDRLQMGRIDTALIGAHVMNFVPVRDAAVRRFVRGAMRVNPNIRDEIKAVPFTVASSGPVPTPGGGINLEAPRHRDRLFGTRLVPGDVPLRLPLDPSALPFALVRNRRWLTAAALAQSARVGVGQFVSEFLSLEAARGTAELTPFQTRGHEEFSPTRFARLLNAGRIGERHLRSSLQDWWCATARGVPAPPGFSLSSFYLNACSYAGMGVR